jgi:hypothetical protein
MTQYATQRFLQGKPLELDGDAIVPGTTGGEREFTLASDFLEKFGNECILYLYRYAFIDDLDMKNTRRGPARRLCSL